MTRKFLALGMVAYLAFVVACSAKTDEVGEGYGDNDASATTLYPDDPDASTPTVTVETDASFIGDDGGVTSYDASADDDASATYDSSCPPPPPPPPPCGCMDPDASASDDASADPVPGEP